MTRLIIRMAIVFFPLVILGGLIWPVAAFSTPGVQSTGNNVTSDLTEGGSISGHVYTDDGNTPICGVYVMASRVPPSKPTPQPTTTTVTPIPTAPPTTVTTTTVTPIPTAPPTTITPPPTSTTLAALSPEPPVPNAGVVISTSDGSYVIEGLTSGNYLVCAFASGFLGEYYKGVSSYAAATPVNVITPDDTPNINFTLEADTPKPVPPKITSIIPDFGLPGATLKEVMISGFNLIGATEVDFSGTGITASDLTVNDAGTQIMCDVTISNDSVFGARSVNVSTPRGMNSLIGGFHVISPDPPTITSLIPNSDVQGATLERVLITGTNLTGVTSVSLSGTGVTASNFREFSTGTQMLADLAISNTASPGPRDVSVTTRVGISTPLPSGFAVIVSTGSPTVSIMAPVIVPAGGTFTINVNIGGVTNLASWQFDIQYNDTVVQVNSVEGGNAVGPGLIGTTAMPMGAWAFQPPGGPTGKIRVLGYLVPPDYISGSGYLAQIHFVVLGAAGTYSTLHLSNVILCDTGTGERSSTTIDSEVIVANLEPVLAGDANEDGTVSIADLTNVERIILGLNSRTPGADANNDSEVTMSDVTKIEKIILGLDPVKR